MKAVFITIHIGFNFGSILQTIATQNILETVGVDEVDCVNYIPPRVELKRYWDTASQSPVRFLRRLCYFPFYLYSIHKYNGYLRKYCNVSKPIYAKDDFVSKCPKGDVYISGSDQIWNYKHNEGIDKHYFFDGIEGKKIAYASSIGMTDLPLDYTEYIRGQLKKYAYISVREASAVSMLGEWGIRSIQLLDPTFMLNKSEWQRYASKRLIKEPYLFVYLPYNIVDKTLIYKTVRKIADGKMLRVVTYSDSFIGEQEADKTVKFVTPGDILSLFYYADYVVTNSFHGTAFSINMNKQFWVYMPSGFSTRISSILELCSLNSRLLTDVITETQLTQIIDYDVPNSIIESERVKALHYLTKALA